MIRVLIFLAVIAALAFGAGWLADRPGSLVVTWQGYELRTSVLIATGAIVVASLGLVLIWSAVGVIAALPGRVRRRRAARRQERGLAALSRGMIAVGAGDPKEARRQAREAGRLLGDTPLTRLLAAQEAQIAGDGARAATHFRAMAAADETRILGLRGLYIEARREDQPAIARHYAETALAAGANTAWAGNAVLEFQAAEGDWAGALDILAGMVRAGTVERDRGRRLMAVLHTARALELEAGAPEAARDLALAANREAPDLVPAATAAARLLARTGDPRRGARILERIWKLTDHPEVAEAYAELQPGDSVRDRLGRVERLARLRPSSRQGAMALARAAIDARDWAAARAALAEVVADQPGERACLLMAEIEDGAHGDDGRVREWLSRAVRAPRDPAWMADGRVLAAWAPVAPGTGRLDAVDWRTPSDSSGNRIASELVLAALPAGSGTVMQPQAPARTEPDVDEPLDLTPAPAANTEKAAAEPSAGDEVPPPRPPDDPGPDGEDDPTLRQDR